MSIIGAEEIRNGDGGIGEMILKHLQKIIVCAFIALEGLFYALYLARVISTDIAYAAIVCCFLFCLACLITKGKKSVTDFLLCAGLFLTCIADIFLGFFKNDFLFVTIGVLIFTAVQLVYSLRIAAMRPGRRRLFDRQFKTSLIVRAAAVAASCLAAYLICRGKPVLDEQPFLIFLSAFYIANAGVNVVYSGINFKQNPLVPVGLFLLFVCDIFLGLTFLGAPVNQGYLSTVSIYWIFYLPSQPLLALSVLELGKPKPAEPAVNLAAAG